MEKFLYDFKKLIREGSYDNTYKMAWARSLVELASLNTLTDEYIPISLEEIARCFIKYYWDQTIHFDLIQGSNPKKPPVAVSIVKDLIEHYKVVTNSNRPEFYIRIESTLTKSVLEKQIKKMVKVLKENVSYRFLNLSGHDYSYIYNYQKGDNQLLMKKEYVELLKLNDTYLYELINYKWGLILESFNISPKINKKVKIMDDREITRKPLKIFKDYLDKENPNRTCFYCEKLINESEQSIDHVIPWSYLYSDDIWNLVYSCKSCNSSKSNIIPSEEIIQKLIKRNNKLVSLINDDKKVYDELLLAIEKDYVNKFWIGCKS